jgi:hypothetical protein
MLKLDETKDSLWHSHQSSHQPANLHPHQNDEADVLGYIYWAYIFILFHFGGPFRWEIRVDL